MWSWARQSHQNGKLLSAFFHGTVMLAVSAFRYGMTASGVEVVVAEGRSHGCE